MERLSLSILSILALTTGCLDNNTLGSEGPKDGSGGGGGGGTESNSDDSAILPWNSELELEEECACEKDSEVCNVAGACTARCLGDTCAQWESLGSVRSLKASNGALFWSTDGPKDTLNNSTSSGHILTVTSSEDTPSRLATGYREPEIVDIVEDYLYFRDLNGKGFRVAVDGGEVETIQRPSGGRLVAVSEAGAFFLAQTADSQNQLWRVPVGSSDDEVVEAETLLLATTEEGWADVAVSGPHGVLYGSDSYILFDPLFDGDAGEATLSTQVADQYSNEEQTKLVISSDSILFQPGQWGLYQQPLNGDAGRLSWNIIAESVEETSIDDYLVFEDRGFVAYEAYGEDGYFGSGIDSYSLTDADDKELIVSEDLLGGVRPLIAVTKDSLYWTPWRRGNGYIFRTEL